MTAATVPLTERQERELAYHEARASRTDHLIEQPVNFDVIEDRVRRPWNGYWSTYDVLLGAGLAGKHVLVPGCGYGEDAIRLAKIGAHVHASDLSPALVDIARARAARHGLPDIGFTVGPAEELEEEDDSIDAVFWNDILHHLDVAAALGEARRVLKPGGQVIVNELYTHSVLQRIRESRLVSQVLYGRMVKFIYGSSDPYITDDERKLDERELRMLQEFLQPGWRVQYFYMLCGRIWPTGYARLATLDRIVLNSSDWLGRAGAGRFVLSGTVRK